MFHKRNLTKKYNFERKELYNLRFTGYRTHKMGSALYYSIFFVTTIWIAYMLLLVFDYYELFGFPLFLEKNYLSQIFVLFWVIFAFD
jgi:hypothetical protein